MTDQNAAELTAAINRLCDLIEEQHEDFSVLSALNKTRMEFTDCVRTEFIPAIREHVNALKSSRS